jgi:hypothetical protein
VVGPGRLRKKDQLAQLVEELGIPGYLCCSDRTSCQTVQMPITTSLLETEGSALDSHFIIG